MFFFKKKLVSIDFSNCFSSAICRSLHAVTDQASLFGPFIFRKVFTLAMWKKGVKQVGWIHSSGNFKQLQEPNLSSWGTTIRVPTC